MGGLLDLAATNLTSPAILCFALGLAAALVRSDLSVPEAAAKALSLYLLFAIGFKGGAGVAAHGMDARLVGALVAGVALSAAIPLVAFGYLRAISRLSQTDAAAVAAHYGSISIVTFVAGTATVQAAGLMAEPYMVAVAAAMEAPAILTALWLAHRGRAPDPADESGGSLMREVLLNGSIVLLVGAFAIGWITGERGLAQIDSFIVAPFLGVLCLFLLDMGLVAGRGLRGSRGVITMPLVLFGVTMPLIGAAFGLAAALAVGLSAGGAALMMTLAASASYIAVPAAMRVALPEANPAIYLTLALGVTFPFNLTIGLPLYMAVAAALIQG
jgi:uncharacterized protein